MFLLVASVIAVFSFSFESQKVATCGPGDQVSVLLLNEQAVMVQRFTAFELTETALQSNKTEAISRSTNMQRIIAPTFLSIDEAPDIGRNELAVVKEKSKQSTYNGLGHDHFARADV